MSLAHSIGLFTHPDQEWQEIRNSSESIPKLYFGHILLLALIPCIAAYFGTTQVGWQIGDGQIVKLTPASAGSLCLLFYGAIISGIYILGRFIDLFSATYGVSREKPLGVTLAAYTATPLMLAGVSAAYPSVWLNVLLGLVALSYAVYLLYEGLPILMRIPADQGFMFATSVLTVGLVMAVGLLAISVVIWGMGIGPVYTY